MDIFALAVPVIIFSRATAPKRTGKILTGHLKMTTAALSAAMGKMMMAFKKKVTSEIQWFSCENSKHNRM